MLQLSERKGQGKGKKKKKEKEGKRLEGLIEQVNTPRQMVPLLVEEEQTILL